MQYSLINYIAYNVGSDLNNNLKPHTALFNLYEDPMSLNVVDRASKKKSFKVLELI